MYKIAYSNELLCDLIIENDINIVVLAEYKADISELIQALYQEGRIMTEYYTIGCKRITIIGDIKNVKSCYHSNYSSMQLINNDFILCCVHLSSQIFSGNDELREVEASRIIREINSLEKTNNTKNTIVVGDFNVDPFDKLMIKPFYFYGQPIYDVSAKEAHKIVEESYYMFYNPMWNMLFLSIFNTEKITQVMQELINIFQIYKDADQPSQELQIDNVDNNDDNNN